MLVAALYVDPRGPYPALEGVDTWDEERDARGYEGPLPVVAHPPCGPWGRLAALCSEQDPDLALRAVDQVRRWGGVLEHPAGSRLWAARGLPLPATGEVDAHGGWSVAVEQVSWGHPCRKPTWLYLVGVDGWLWQTTLRRGGEPTHEIASRARRAPGRLCPSAAQRRRTPPAFAAWLVEVARSVHLSKLRDLVSDVAARGSEVQYRAALRALREAERQALARCSPREAELRRRDPAHAAAG